MGKNGRRCRIGIDVGGTFTDLALYDLDAGSMIHYKEPSSPDDPSRAVEKGLVNVIERAGLKPASVELIVHGTTIALNTIIQRKGVPTALVVSQGNRDVFEIGRARLPSSFNFHMGKEVPLIPRDLIFEISARGKADGSVIAPVDEAEVGQVAEQMRERDIAAVAVMLLNSYIDGGLEAQVADALRTMLPGVLVTQSAQLWPEIREYERALVTALNAYVNPMMDRYLKRLEERLHRVGIRGALYITASNGGCMSVQTARARPIDTVLSGPAGGVVAATHLAKLIGHQSILSFDMGGTSSDTALAAAGEPEYAATTHIGDFPLMLPVVNVASIGSGGGSMVWVDPQGLLKVGPQSAGADPGPACYGRGGREATVTDCFVAVGYIDPAKFLGGRMVLDKRAALEALDAVAGSIGMGGADRVAQGAEAALRIATAKMATELYKLMAQRGLDPRDFALVAFGGAGPTLANLLAEEARLSRIVVPPASGTFGAMGALLTDVKRDYVRSLHRRLDTGPELAGELRGAFDDLEKEGLDWIDGEGDIVEETELSWSAEMRYKDQAYDLDVPIPREVRQTLAGDTLAELFHQAHQRVYGFPDKESPVELTALRTRVVGRVPAIDLPKVESSTEPPRPIGSRKVYSGRMWRDVLVYERASLRAGQRFAGPAIVEQEDTTTVILPGWGAEVESFGILNIHRLDAAQ